MFRLLQRLLLPVFVLALLIGVLNIKDEFGFDPIDEVEIDDSSSELLTPVFSLRRAPNLLVFGVVSGPGSAVTLEVRCEIAHLKFSRSSSFCFLSNASSSSAELSSIRSVNPQAPDPNMSTVSTTAEGVITRHCAAGVKVLNRTPV